MLEIQVTRAAYMDGACTGPYIYGSRTRRVKYVVEVFALRRTV